MNVSIVISCHGNVVKGFFTLWSNICVCVCVFTTSDCPVIYDGQFIIIYVYYNFRIILLPSDM
jgi:hypothetical protein